MEIIDRGEVFKQIIASLKIKFTNSFVGSNELMQIKKHLEDLMPGVSVVLLDMPICSIDEDGELTEVDGKTLTTSNRMLRDYSDFSTIKSYPYVYIYAVSLINNPTTNEERILVRLAEYNLKKKATTFTISERVYEEFCRVADKLAINRSKFVENKFVEFININK